MVKENLRERNTSSDVSNEASLVTSTDFCAWWHNGIKKAPHFRERLLLFLLGLNQGPPD